MVDFRWSMAQSRPRYGEIYTLDCGWERRLALVPGLGVSGGSCELSLDFNDVGALSSFFVSDYLEKGECATPPPAAQHLRVAPTRARIPSSHPPPRSPPHANPLVARLVSLVGASLRVALGERDKGKGESLAPDAVAC